MRYQFIDDHRASWPLSTMCRVMEVTRQGNHAWRKRGESQRAIRQVRLLSRIRSLYEARNGRYGSPRITLELKKSGETVSFKTVESLMRKAGLRAKGGRRFRSTTDSTQTVSPAPNLLDQKFVAHTPYSVWLSDFTELPCRRGKAYAVAIMDLCSRRILAVSIASTMQTQILLDTLDEACQYRNVRQRHPIIFHSEQGSQYSAEMFRRELTKRGFQQSMSRKGNCHDNAPMESFWARMKTELGLPLLFDDINEARAVVRNYIHIFYNRLRIHSGIDYMSPVTFEEQFISFNRDEVHCQPNGGKIPLLLLTPHIRTLKQRHKQPLWHHKDRLWGTNVRLHTKSQWCTMIVLGHVPCPATNIAVTTTCRVV